MSRNLTAQAKTTVSASTGKVWQALVTPNAIKQYMFGTDVATDWAAGSGVTWSGEMKGRKYEDKGVIQKFEPERTLQYTHFSPLSGKPDKPENYHTVTIALAGVGGKTEVTLTQDNNATEDARAQAERTWAAMLEGLKKYVEGSA